MQPMGRSLIGIFNELQDLCYKCSAPVCFITAGRKSDDARIRANVIHVRMHRRLRDMREQRLHRGLVQVSRPKDNVITRSKRTHGNDAQPERPILCVERARAVQVKEAPV